MYSKTGFYQLVLLMGMIVGNAFLSSRIMAADIRVAIIAKPEGRNVADLLTVALSRQPGMVVLYGRA